MDDRDAKEELKWEQDEEWNEKLEEEFKQVFDYLDVYGRGSIEADKVQMLVKACGVNVDMEAINDMVAFESGMGSGIPKFNMQTFIRAIKYGFTSKSMEDDLKGTWRHLMRKYISTDAPKELFAGQEILQEVFKQMKITVETPKCKRMLGNRDTLRGKKLMKRLMGKEDG